LADPRDTSASLLCLVASSGYCWASVAVMRMIWLPWPCRPGRGPGGVVPCGMPARPSQPVWQTSAVAGCPSEARVCKLRLGWEDGDVDLRLRFADSA
jgi:hypothetical protein